MLKLLALDRFTISLFFMIFLASVLPVRGSVAELFNQITVIAIAMLFFLHGAKLSREAVIAGIMHWRLHTLVFAFTFILFPCLGLLAQPILMPVLGETLYWGFLFLCCLPSTVQSSIAFTSVANGNVAGAICSASFSNIIGMFITPILVAFFILGQNQHDYDPTSAIVKIVLLLLLELDNLASIASRSFPSSTYIVWMPILAAALITGFELSIKIQLDLLRLKSLEIMS